MRSAKSLDTGAVDAVLRLEDVACGVGHIHALRNVNLDIGPGEFHVVIGDHGAGKSSLANLTAGLLRLKSGRRFFNGTAYPTLSQREARKLKIELVCQETHLINCMTVTDNLLIPDLIKSRPFFFKKRAWHKECREILERYDFDFPPETLVQELRPSEQLIVYFLRSVLRQPHLLVLDAILEQLSAEDLDKVLRVLASLKERGTAILCLAHGIDEVASLADRVTILRNGKTIVTESIENVDKVNLIKLCYSQLAEHSKTGDSREFYQLLRYNEAILQKLPINLVVADNDNRIKMINDHGRQYFNLGGDYRKLLVDDLFSADDGKALTLIKEAFEEQREAVFYAVPINVGGKETTADIKILPIGDGAFFIGNILIVEDISRQEALRQQLTMTEKLASVGILSAGVAHEINNPLEIIYNHLNYLKFNIEKVHVSETIDLIEEELEDIKQIVSNLISFSDRTRVVIEELDLSDLLLSIIALLRIDARRRNIDISFSPPDCPVVVEARKNEIKQVFLNLFRNSFEASGDAGSIRIEADMLEENGKPLALIRFMDDGCGILDEDPSNIFLPFYSSKLGKDANLGLGLSVSYGIITKYNGSIEVRNREEGGCEFSILLPGVPCDQDREA
jgi:signal transduction histidine kinase/ABC-type branched-subunit amino acid transport system ATPase component